jgi:PBP1b-binding outer membrane lipoprotein LpoB
MRKILFLAMLIYSCTAASGQSAAPDRYSYYIEISGANTKTKVEVLSGLVKSKPGITVFNQYRAARPFFVLLSNIPVSKAIFSDWVKTLGVELVHFEKKEITGAFIKSRRQEKKPGQKSDKLHAGKN